jgi:uncharacterized protein
VGGLAEGTTGCPTWAIAELLTTMAVPADAEGRRAKGGLGERGAAMKSRWMDGGDGRTFLVVFDTGDDVPEDLLRFARQAGIEGASFTAIGAFEEATLAFFDLERKDYLEIPVREQVEVLAMVGNIGVHGDELKVHAHVTLGTRDGTARGGHLLSARVRPTLEMVVRETPSPIRRTMDEATGLPLIDAEA